VIRQCFGCDMGTSGAGILSDGEEYFSRIAPLLFC
jgi:hypothetical protein